MGLLANLFSCNKIKNKIKNKTEKIGNKIEEVDNKINPGAPYKKAGIDRFYWEAEDSERYIIPLIKPYHLDNFKVSEEWDLVPHTTKGVPFSPVTAINVKNEYI